MDAAHATSPDPGLEQLKAAPEQIVGLSITRQYSFTGPELAELQLAALRKRFADLVDKVSLLGRFAETQGVKEIASLEDGALLLVPHTMYKSYPLAAIETNRFDRMTKWLGTLTAYDLSGVDVSACQSIDDWIEALERQSPLRVRHSSGTTGKLSLVPGSLAEQKYKALAFRRYLQGFGDEPDADVDDLSDLPIICCAHRKGGMSAARLLDALQEHLYGGDDSMIVTTQPGRFSADLLSLGGRLEGAQARGEMGQLQLAPGLLARRDAFMTEREEAPKRLDAFLDRLDSQFRGRRVIFQAVTPHAVDVAVPALARGVEQVFAPDSLMHIVGGSKGRALPDGYRQIVERFTGATYPRDGYGMSEAVASTTRMCPAGVYHVMPNIIPYVLDPKSGQPAPRTGVQKGRLGILDIAAFDRWGGFLSGDEVTLHWGDTQPCACGRKGAYVSSVRRYSEAEGGDDKITCTGAPGVHDQALQYITGAVG